MRVEIAHHPRPVMLLPNSWLGDTSDYLGMEVAVNIRKLGTLPESQEAG